MNVHFMPVGNPAPPRPRSPDFLTSSTTWSGVIVSTTLRSASYPPDCSYTESVCDPSFPTFRVRTRSIAPPPASGKAVEEAVRLLRREVLVVVVVHLEHRRRAARAEALDAHERELPVGGRLAAMDAELPLEMPHQLVGAPEHARQRRAHLQ